MQIADATKRLDQIGTWLNCPFGNEYKEPILLSLLNYASLYFIAIYIPSDTNNKSITCNNFAHH